MRRSGNFACARLIFGIVAASLHLAFTAAGAAQVSWGAAVSNGVGLADGTDLPAGDLVRLGSFNLTPAQIAANASNLPFLESHFVEFGRALIGDGNVAGDGVRHPAHWFANSTNSSDNLGIAGARIYYWIFNTVPGTTPNQIGIYTAPANSAWVFPADAQIPNTTSTDLSQVPHDSSGIIVGGFGVGTSDLSGSPLYNLAVVSSNSTPTPTPTVTPTPGGSPTPTPTPGSTPTPTVSPTVTPTPGGSPTPTPSATPAPSATPTASATPGSSATPTPSATPGSSGTPTPGSSPSPSATTGNTLANLSTRGVVETGENVLIGGFIVQGSGSKRVIIRAIGPSLQNAGVNGALTDPTLTLFDSHGTPLASNDNWGDSAQKQQIIDTQIAPSDPRESAILEALSPANYTAVVSGVDGSTGIALVEVYDLDSKGSSKLVNLSTRGHVQTGNGVLIGGFIVGGQSSEKLVFRAIGPSLARANPPIADALADPVLELHNAQGALIFSNDNWTESPQKQQFIDLGIAPTDQKESAILATLAPGNYTAVVSGGNGSSGIALVEVYNVTGR